jgi:hypothetical protein
VDSSNSSNTISPTPLEGSIEIEVLIVMMDLENDEDDVRRIMVSMTVTTTEGAVVVVVVVVVEEEAEIEEGRHVEIDPGVHRDGNVVVEVGVLPTARTLVGVAIPTRTDLGPEVGSDHTLILILLVAIRNNC